MKKFLVLQALSMCLLWMSPVKLVAQNVVINNDGSSAEASALLDIKSTDKGILLPRMTASQRDAIINPAQGLLVFQSDGTPGFCYYDGASWISLFSGKVIDNQGVVADYGLVSTFAGSTIGYADGFSIAASFNNPLGITIDPITGNLYVSDRNNHSIRRITPSGYVTSIAGSTVPGSTNGTGQAARFRYPDGIAVDAAGNIYVADAGNNLIRKITPGAVVSTMAGSGASGFADGMGVNAVFRNPVAVAVDTAGNIYVADSENNSIRKISPAGNVTTLAGTGTPGFTNGPGNTASFNQPAGLAVDATGNIYVADRRNHCIRKITPAGVVTTFAGTGSAGAADGTLTTARFNLPKAITIDLLGTMYVGDEANYKVRKITQDGMVSTLAGAGSPGFADGLNTTAYFDTPSGLVADAKGNLYVTDGLNHRIRKIIIY